MKNKLFNSVFEMQLRLLLLLNAGKRNWYSLGRLVSLDFIICYAEEFQLPFKSPNGDNDYMYGELSNRNELAEAAIKELVLDGLADVKIEAGYQFKISDAGKKYAKTFKSEYAMQYRNIAIAAIKEFRGSTDYDLEKSINENAVNSLKGGLLDVSYKEYKD